MECIKKIIFSWDGNYQIEPKSNWHREAMGYFNMENQRMF